MIFQTQRPGQGIPGNEFIIGVFAIIVVVCQHQQTVRIFIAQGHTHCRQTFCLFHCANRSAGFNGEAAEVFTGIKIVNLQLADICVRGQQVTTCIIEFDDRKAFHVARELAEGLGVIDRYRLGIGFRLRADLPHTYGFL